MSATADRPLTDAQERALIALDEISVVRVGEPREWFETSKFWRYVPTVAALARRGLVDLRLRVVWQARITDDGIEMLDSMGD